MYTSPSVSGYLIARVVDNLIICGLYGSIIQAYSACPGLAPKKKEEISVYFSLRRGRERKGERAGSKESAAQGTVTAMTTQELLTCSKAFMKDLQSVRRMVRVH
uniref:Uncharacterized protein n=1 Tax=Glossina austeni TaxID=7395 RepID=A0A1A9V3L7_GLOAU